MALLVRYQAARAWLPRCCPPLSLLRAPLTCRQPAADVYSVVLSAGGCRTKDPREGDDPLRVGGDDPLRVGSIPHAHPLLVAELAQPPHPRMPLCWLECRPVLAAAVLPPVTFARADPLGIHKLHHRRRSVASGSSLPCQRPFALQAIPTTTIVLWNLIRS